MGSISVDAGGLGAALTGPGFMFWGAVAAIGLLMLAVGGVVHWRARERARRRTALLRRVFGSEYARAVNAYRGRRLGEEELLKRLRRRREMRLRDLDTAEREQFEAAWQSALALFVESPETAVREADVLLVEVMRVRGYPIERFDERASLISLDFPELVEELRAAHAVALAADEAGPDDTERLRQALRAYGSLFDALLGHGQTSAASGV